MALYIDPLQRLRPIREEDLAGLVLADRAQGQAMTSVLAYDVYRSGDSLVIEFDVPGAVGADVNVVVEDRSLVVEVSRRLMQGKGVDVIEAGRQHGTFSSRLFLGERWDLDGLRASIGNGVLTVRAPIVHEMGRRRVFVADADEQGQHEGSSEDELGAPLALRTPAA